MKLLKLYLKNFKSIKDEKIIDFQSSVTFLTGPNGFGKTTIFDAIELCLIDSLYRIIDEKTTCKIHDKRSKPDKPFYANTRNQEVIIKLLIENTEGIKKTIVLYEKCNLMKYQYASKDSLKRYLIEGDVITKIIDFSKHKEIKQDDLDRFLNLPKEMSLSDIYRIFNYLQQEETTYFLKKTEYERKNEMDFLFKTDLAKKHLSNIEKYSNSLEKIESDLKTKIETLVEEKFKLQPSYKRMFFHDNFDFDNEKLFENITIEECDLQRKNFSSELNKLKEFLSVFSPQEFEKKIKCKQIEDIKNENDYLKYFILQNFLAAPTLSTLEKKFSLLEDDNQLDFFILQKLLQNIENYEEIHKKLLLIEKFNKIGNYELLLKEIPSYLQAFSKELEEKFNELYLNRTQIISTSSTIEIALNQVIKARCIIKEKFEYLEKNNECPFCGQPWDTYHELLEQFDKKTIALDAIKTSNNNVLEILDKQIREVVELPLRAIINDYAEKNKSIDIVILKRMRDLKNSNITINDISHEYDEFIISEITNISSLNSVKENFKTKFRENLMIDSEVFSLIRKLKMIKVNLETLFDKKLFPNTEELNNFILNLVSDKKISIVIIDEVLKNLKLYLENYQNNFKFSVELSQDVNNFYKTYFEKNEKLYSSFKIQDIDCKIEYINSLYNLRQDKFLKSLRTRQAELEKIRKKLDDLTTSYNEQIKEYKEKMSSKIKLPFYIYTAKILQNYQQGMGLFLISEGESIVFLPDGDNSHDALHNLSSGQLSVVALAFCLAVNKSYNLSNSMKFLAIDDPIQEMDNLNIHSFIELIRNEFCEDYQLLFSTHNDNYALFMKYKLEKFKKDSVKLLNVQREFFS